MPKKQHVSRRHESATPTELDNTVPAEPATPFNPEKMMRDLHKLIAQQDFQNPEEMETFLNSLIGSRIPETVAETPLERAQELIYEAEDTILPAKRQQLARQALEISPDCADAYAILAEAERSPLKQLELLEQAMAAGERAIGAEDFQQMTGHFWGILETRPYMRACAAVAGLSWMLGRHERAIELYQHMLRLNPNDNQGVRFILTNCLLEKDAYDALDVLLKQFKNDITANWAYSSALLTFARYGRGARADKALARAIKVNAFVPDYLLRRKRMPKELPDHIGFGDNSEAVDYVALSIRAWEHTPGALDWLRQYRAQSDTLKTK